MLKESSHDREYRELQYGNGILNNVKEMVNEFNKYFVNNIREIAAGNGEDDLLIGNEHPICALNQFNRLHVGDLKNMMRKLVNKEQLRKGSRLR